MAAVGGKDSVQMVGAMAVVSMKYPVHHTSHHGVKVHLNAVACEI